MDCDVLESTRNSPYLAWNDGIAARFFRPDMAGRQVYLYVTEEVLAEVGERIGSQAGDFVGAVRSGPPGATSPRHCRRALEIKNGWRAKGFAYPPYINYLALFVLAGGHEGDFAPHAYYPRLWDLLGEPGRTMPPLFDRMLELWEDLERWATEDRDAELGIFEVRSVGKWVHVGLPLAQTILTEAERHALPRIFAAAGMDPHAPPSAGELSRALEAHGQAFLRPRTRHALSRGPDAFRAALLDLVADHLVDWDGEVTPDGAETRLVGTQAPLRMCIALDRVARAVRPALRCKPKRPFPERGLHAAVPGRGRVSCVEYLPGWSSLLIDEETGAEYIPPDRVWAGGLSLRDDHRHWCLQLRPARLRVFVEGAAEGLAGLVEVPTVPPDGVFYLAHRTVDRPILEDWAAAECGSWRLIEIDSGLPAGWSIAVAADAAGDAGIRAVDPAAGFPDFVSIRFMGGIRASAAGNVFLAFSPPHVAATGLHAGDAVRCEGRALAPLVGRAGLYRLPDGLPGDTRLTVEVIRGSDVARRASLSLASGFSWRMERPAVALGPCGERLEDASHGGFSGALAPGAADPFVPDLLRSPGLPDVGAICFLGSRPGAVSVWPKEPLPEWQPVWAIAKGGGQPPVFCGTSLAHALPSARRVGGRRNVEQWRRVLRSRHWRVPPPRDAAVRALWRRYREVARGLA